MQESKQASWAREHDDSPSDESANDRDAGTAPNTESDADGWQQYRRWISKAPAPRGRRTGVDPSLYTWKGYRNWTEQVKRDWSEK